MKPQFLEILEPPLNGKRVISVIRDAVFNDTTGSPKGKGGIYLGVTGKQKPNFERNRGKEIILRNRGFRFFVNKGTSLFLQIYFRGIGQLTDITIPQGGPRR